MLQSMGEDSTQLDNEIADLQTRIEQSEGGSPAEPAPAAARQAVAMEVGQQVRVLPPERAGAACEAAGIKWNPARKKRAGGCGTVVEGLAEGKLKVKFEDEVTDPATGAVLRTDTQTLAF